MIMCIWFDIDRKQRAPLCQLTVTLVDSYLGSRSDYAIVDGCLARDREYSVVRYIDCFVT